jgi:LmbE family N-acetylglucosaminyl deacetylase
MADRDHDVSGMTSPELERARRDLQVSLALAFPGSPVRVPIERARRELAASLRLARPGSVVTTSRNEA